MRKQPGYQSSLQYLRQYYKEVYDECQMPNSKIVWQINTQEDTQQPEQPSLEQLKKLRDAYQREIDQLELLQNDQNLHKCYNMISLQSQSYTAKKMIHIGPSSETNFKAKLIHGSVVMGPEQRQSPLGFNREDQSPDDFVEQPPPSVFSTIEG